MATVDVQAGATGVLLFQVTGYGSMGERWLADRHNIRQSMRYDANGLSQQIDPASHPEDWDLLLTDVFNKAPAKIGIGSDTVYAADGDGR